MTTFPVFEASIGGALIAVVLFMLWKRARSEGALDDRSVKQVDQRDELIQSLGERNNILEDRNREWADRYHTATQRNMQLAGELANKVMTAVEEVRRQHNESMARIWQRVEQTELNLMRCEEGHRLCREDTAQLRAELAAVREQAAAAPSQMPLPGVRQGR